MEDQSSQTSLHLRVKAEELSPFTTVLQSGIERKVPQGLAVGVFLSQLPEFDAAYIADTVQTIFLNGTAIDDLTTPFSGERPVLAISAAMPGLAGAIFRKNSFHAALRTETKGASDQHGQQQELTVLLKLFNAIARDKGHLLLAEGQIMAASQVARFFSDRPFLVDAIVTATINGRQVAPASLSDQLKNTDKVLLTIVADHD